MVVFRTRDNTGDDDEPANAPRGSCKALTLTDLRCYYFPSASIQASLWRDQGLDKFPGLGVIADLWRRLVRHVASELVACLLQTGINHDDELDIARKRFDGFITEAGQTGLWEKEGRLAWYWARATTQEWHNRGKREGTTVSVHGSTRSVLSGTNAANFDKDVSDSSAPANQIDIGTAKEKPPKIAKQNSNLNSLRNTVQSARVHLKAYRSNVEAHIAASADVDRANAMLETAMDGEREYDLEQEVKRAEGKLKDVEARGGVVAREVHQLSQELDSWHRNAAEEET